MDHLEKIIQGKSDTKDKDTFLLCIRQEWSLYRDLSSITVIVSSNLFSGVQPPRMAANYPERRSCKTSSIERVRDKVEDQSPKKHFSIT